MNKSQSKRAILQCDNLSKTYLDAGQAVSVLTSINLSVAAGECVAVIGPSGSGKSTLLHLLGGLETPTGGQVKLQGQDLQQLSERQRCQIRNRQLGFVYQFHHLLPEFTAEENVALPLLVGGASPQKSCDRARATLAELGLQHRGHHRIGQLSGGERQRVAIARALVTRPSCLLADEPTGNLDQATAFGVYEALIQLADAQGTSVVVVTHDLTLAHKMHRTVRLEDGYLHATERDPSRQ